MVLSDHLLIQICLFSAKLVIWIGAEGLGKFQSAGSTWLWEGMDVLGGGENTSFGSSDL